MNKNNNKSSVSQEAISAKTPLRIGELLVKEGLLKKEDLQEALLIQKKEADMRRLPLGRILVKIGALSRSDLERLLDHPELKRNLGILALEKGLIDVDQLKLCLKNKRSDQLIGKVLVDKGLMTHNDLTKLIKEQINALRIGELAIKLKLISEKDLKAALKIQKSSRALGEILCELSLVSPMSLNYVLRKYNKQSDFGELLLKLGLITRKQFTAARQELSYSSDSMEEILLRKKFITQKQLNAALAKYYNISFKELDDFVYPEEEKKLLVRIIAQKYAEKNLILPISLKGKNLNVAISRKENLYTTYELQHMYNSFDISCIVITQEKFEELFEILYNKHLSGNEATIKDEATLQEEDDNFLELDIDEHTEEKYGKKAYYGTKDVEAEEIVNFIVKYGIINGASDIHIEQDRRGANLRYRVDGILRPANIGWLNAKLEEKTNAIISRIKVMSNLDIAERRLPQDGVFRINYYDKSKGKKFDLDFRVATCCAIVGENVSIRILDSRKVGLGLDDLSHSPHVLKTLKTLLRSSAGMILVCGPTGSGKSSTLYAALQHIHSSEIKIITAEDFIEYSFPGIMQTQIKPKIDLTFSRLLRSFLRLDPDVILVGEIRDVQTAKISFDAAQTGHLLLSTIHANDAVSSITRLMDLGVEYGQMASSLMGVVAQRLIRKICSSCIKEHVPDEDKWGMLFAKYPSHLRFYKGQGCDSCNFTGYSGRTLLSEFFIIDHEISQALNRRLNEDSIRKIALENGMKTMLDDGISKLKEVTLSEILRVMPYDIIKEFRSRQTAGAAFDFPDKTMDGISRDMHENKDMSSSVFCISNPETQESIINTMKKRYETLKAKNGDNSGGVDASLFREFIIDKFHHICNQYNCKSISFNMENREGKTEISAVPCA